MLGQWDNRPSNSAYYIEDCRILRLVSWLKFKRQYKEGAQLDCKDIFTNSIQFSFFCRSVNLGRFGHKPVCIYSTIQNSHKINPILPFFLVFMSGYNQFAWPQDDGSRQLFFFSFPAFVLPSFVVLLFSDNTDKISQ